MENDSTIDRRRVKTREESKLVQDFFLRFSKHHFTVSNHAEEEGRVIRF